MIGLRLGSLDSVEEIKTALRDIETYLAQLFPDDAPTGDAQVLMRDPEGNIRQYTIQTGGGSTVTVNETTRVISIAVP